MIDTMQRFNELLPLAMYIPKVTSTENIHSITESVMAATSVTFESGLFSAVG